ERQPTKLNRKIQGWRVPSAPNPLSSAQSENASATNRAKSVRGRFNCLCSSCSWRAGDANIRQPGKQCSGLYVRTTNEPHAQYERPQFLRLFVIRNLPSEQLPREARANLASDL